MPILLLNKLTYRQSLNKFIEFSLIFTIALWTIIREQKQIQVAIESGILLRESRLNLEKSLAVELALAPPTTLHFFSSTLVSILQNTSLASFFLLLMTLIAYFFGLFLIATSLGLPKFVTLSILTFVAVFNDFFEDNFINVYPFEIDSVNSWGQIGVSFSILLVGLVSQKKYNISLVIICLLLGFQILWGLWTLSLTLLAFVIIFRRSIFKQFKINKITFLVSAAIFTMSLVVLAVNINLYKDSLTSSKNLFIYYEVWDYHRGHFFVFDSIKNSIFLLILLVLFYMLSQNRNYSIKYIILFFSFSIVFSVVLYCLQNYNNFFYNQFITFMVGRFFNLHAAVSLIILSSTLYVSFLFILLKIKLLNTCISKFLTSFIVIFLSLLAYINYSYIIAPKSFLELKENIKNNLYKPLPNYCSLLVTGNILTIGQISKLMISDCRVAPILDTTQTDTVTGSEALATKLRTYTEEIYGIDFKNPEITAEKYGLEFSRTSDIPQELTERIWSLRTFEEWNDLICRYAIDQIIVSNDSYLIFRDFKKSNNHRFYNVKCIQNDDLAPLGVTFSSRLPIEFFKTGQYFFWITADRNQFLLDNKTNQQFAGTFSFSANPNPCQTANKVNIIHSNYKHVLGSINIGKDPKKFSIPITLEPYEKLPIEFSKIEGQKCYVDNDIRDLTFELSAIQFLKD